ncbi:hypothetical protein BJY04DRAFT_214248 [Aspergillus karnatakaensis]|uniref:uncharacterized protein n=1 Tax=Aspergillus karnatakaensis TaxID=1810916 RepID=UPI003CCC99F4
MSRTKRENSASQAQAQAQNISQPQTFPLAHPPPKSNNSRQCLRLSSRLLLQIQQLTPSPAKLSSPPRAVPILDLYQPSTFGKHIPKAPGARKAHSRDLYIRQSEAFTHIRTRSKKRDSHETNGHGHGGESETNGYNNSSNGTKPRSVSNTSSKSKSTATSASRSRAGSRSRSGSGSGDEEAREKRVSFKSRRRRKSTSSPGDDDDDDEDGEGDVVAVIYTSPKARSKSEVAAEAELFFPLSGRSWDATSTGAGRYRFQAPRTDAGGSSASGETVVFDWEKRPPSRASAVSGSGSGSAEKEPDDDRFVLSISSPSSTSLSLRRPWLAQLTRKGLQVGGLEAWAEELRGLVIDDGAGAGAAGDGAGLYMLIVTMGVWVARREGWVG